jgi:mono/diheme cytochrome c family protein
MTRISASFAAVLALGLLGGCGGRHSAAGFRLPENGDAERGKVAFVELKCSTCHTVAGVDLPPPTSVGLPVPLGGMVHEARTDGYLVTSMINPSHRLAHVSRTALTDPQEDSHMPRYAREMTVRQMVDLVAFLQSTYEIAPPPSATP